ncbi:hypothetical protein B0H17DRAFT_1223412 [Mycena rosella]|uniref:Uncharacterized protein n=1 Tax=Mycena rosella TaxID=1033263 RepID=A0AAD7H2G8_MYCRO|nr:hypothetical protein B0H17DRAFT_1223412 [Mycena rosella]
MDWAVRRARHGRGRRFGGSATSKPVPPSSRHAKDSTQPYSLEEQESRHRPSVSCERPHSPRISSPLGRNEGARKWTKFIWAMEGVKKWRGKLQTPHPSCNMRPSTVGNPHQTPHHPVEWRIARPLTPAEDEGDGEGLIGGRERVDVCHRRAQGGQAARGRRNSCGWGARAEWRWTKSMGGGGIVRAVREMEGQKAGSEVEKEIFIRVPLAYDSWKQDHDREMTHADAGLAGETGVRDEASESRGTRGEGSARRTRGKVSEDYGKGCRWSLCGAASLTREGREPASTACRQPRGIRRVLRLEMAGTRVGGHAGG